MKMKKIIGLVLAGLPCLLMAQANKTAAPTAPVFVRSVEGVKEYKLSNGLQVLLVPDAAQTNFVVNIVYRVGSRHEGYGETGMAHLMEHMLFKGTKKFTSIKQTIADKGASANGTTWYDRTNYYEVLPKADSNLTWALEMEADRMVNSTMKKEDLQKEFSVVRNEFESGENYPDGILQERVLSTMYLWHNYGKSTIGSKEDIERVPMENLDAFYKKYYAPDNATLIVGGGFDEKKTLELIGKYFGGIKNPNRVLKAPYTVEPPQDGERNVELRRNGDMQYIGMGYHTPSYSDKDYVANEAVLELLRNDPTGIFYKALVEKKLATKVYGYTQELYDPGFTYFGCDVPMDKNLDSAKNQFLATANNLANVTVTQEDVDRAKNKLLKLASNVQNNTISFCINITEIIGSGDWRLFYLHRDRIEKLTLAEVQAALKKYYLPSNRTVGVFIPDKNAARVTVADHPDIAALVKDYKGKEVVAQTETFDNSIENIQKNVQYGTLTNGFKYALLKKPAKGDKIYGSIQLKMGNETSLTDKSMLATLTARMIRTGTTTKSKKELNDLLDKIKSSISFFGSGQTVTISVNTDKPNLSAALDVLADLLLHPSFDRNEFDKLKSDLKGEYEANQSDPDFLATTLLGKKTTKYPKGHPLYVQDISEALADLDKVSLADIKKFYENFYGTNHGFGSFVGNIDNDVVKKFLENNLGGFTSKQAFADVEEKYFDIQGSTETIQIADKKNASVYGNIKLPIRETDPDFNALEIANELLGGGAFLSSRIPSRLRESEGMSYGAGSYVEASVKFPATTWGVYAIFNPVFKNRLDSALHEEIAKALKEGFKESELAKSVPSWLQQRKSLLGRDNYLAYMLTNYMSDALPLQYFAEKEASVKKLKLEQVNSALRKYIDQGKLTLVYAGDFIKK